MYMVLKSKHQNTSTALWSDYTTTEIKQDSCYSACTNIRRHLKHWHILYKKKKNPQEKQYVNASSIVIVQHRAQEHQ